MDTINELAADESTARIILAIASEPGDAVTGRMIRTVGASETVARVLADEVPAGPDGDTWQRRLAPRLDAAQIQRVLAETERHGMRVLIPGDAEWPAGIDALGDGAPVALWAKGNPGLLTGPMWDRLTITGARASTAYGEHVTTELVQSAVADSRVVFSGGAYGIDGAAHRAALASNGSTVAVLAGGLDRLYPAGHTDLLTRVGKDGLLLSELPPGAAPTKWRSVDRTTAMGGCCCVPGSCACNCSVEPYRSKIHRSGSLPTSRARPSSRLTRSYWTSGRRGTRSRVVGRTRSVSFAGIATCS